MKRYAPTSFEMSESSNGEWVDIETAAYIHSALKRAFEANEEIHMLLDTGEYDEAYKLTIRNRQSIRNTLQTIDK